MKVDAWRWPILKWSWSIASLLYVIRIRNLGRYVPPLREIIAKRETNSVYVHICVCARIIYSLRCRNRVRPIRIASSPFIIKAIKSVINNPSRICYLMERARRWLFLHQVRSDSELVGRTRTLFNGTRSVGGGILCYEGSRYISSETLIYWETIEATTNQDHTSSPTWLGHLGLFSDWLYPFSVAFDMK